MARLTVDYDTFETRKTFIQHKRNTFRNAQLQLALGAIFSLAATGAVKQLTLHQGWNCNEQKSTGTIRASYPNTAHTESRLCHSHASGRVSAQGSKSLADFI